MRNTENYSGGFISMTLVIIVTGFILSLLLVNSLEVAQFFDQTRIKEYRLMNYYNADSCIDQAILNLSHDFFYRVSTTTQIGDFDCSIDAVYETNGLIKIQATGNYKSILVHKSSLVKLFDNRVEVIKSY